MSRWRSPVGDGAALSLGAAIGLLIHLITFGPGHVLGTSAYWRLPEIDVRGFLIGYRYFLAEPWHLPLFELRTVNLPFTKSLAFTDSVPVFALVNKMVATALPGWRAFSHRSYIGLWSILVYVFQGALAVACMRRLGRRALGDAVLTAIFFVACPPFVARWAHVSLSSHFLLLAAVYLHLRVMQDAERRTQSLARFVVLIIIAVLVNPYHAAVVFAVFVVTLFAMRSAWTGARWLALGTGALVLATALAGFFAREATVKMPGFDLSSTNLLSPFIPVRSGIFGDGKRIANVEAAMFQFEGYAYLGLGILVLFGLALPSLPRLLHPLRRQPFLVLLVAGLFLFSLSNTIWLGSHRVLHFDFPENAIWITQQFRAPGRFVWLPVYGVYLVILRWALARFQDGWQALVVPVLAVVQLAETSGDWALIRAQNQEMGQHLLDFERWPTLIAAHSAVTVHPTFDCAWFGQPWAFPVSSELEYLVSERTLPVNGIYTSRPTRDCGLEKALQSELRAEQGTLYILLGVEKRLSALLERSGAACADFAYGRVCTRDQVALDRGVESGLLVPPSPPPTIVLDERVGLGTAAAPELFVAGFGLEVETGRWTMQDEAAIRFQLERQTGGGPELRFEATAPLCSGRAESNADVWVDGDIVGSLRFDASTNEIDIPHVLKLTHPLGSGRHTIDIRSRDRRPAVEVGCGSDANRVGIFIRAFTVAS